MLSRVRATGMMVSNYKSIGVAVEVVGICCWPVIVYTMAELRVSCMGSSGSYAWTSAPVFPIRAHIHVLSFSKPPFICLSERYWRQLSLGA